MLIFTSAVVINVRLINSDFALSFRLPFVDLLFLPSRLAHSQNYEKCRKLHNFVASREKHVSTVLMKFLLFKHEKKNYFWTVLSQIAHIIQVWNVVWARKQDEREEMCSISFILFFNFSSANTRQLGLRLFIYLFPGRFKSSVAGAIWLQHKKCFWFPGRRASRKHFKTPKRQVNVFR